MPTEPTDGAILLGLLAFLALTAGIHYLLFIRPAPRRRPDYLDVLLAVPVAIRLGLERRRAPKSAGLKGGR